MSMSPAPLLSVFGAAALALGVATQGYHILRKENPRPSLGRGLLVGGLLDMLGLFVLIGGEDKRLMPVCVVGGIGAGIPIAFLWAKYYRPGEPRP
jgi:hypothetical protein